MVRRVNDRAAVGLPELPVSTAKIAGACNCLERAGRRPGREARAAYRKAAYRKNARRLCHETPGVE